MSFFFYKQPDSMDCGPTCLRMVAKYYKRSFSLQSLREKAQIGKLGVNLLGISEAAESIGFRTHALKISYSSLIEQAKLPSILHWDQNHFVVLYKVKPKSFFRHTAILYVADPAKGLITYNESEFMNHWVSDKSDEGKEGIALLLEPTQAFYNFELQEVKDENRQSGFRTVAGYVLPYKGLVLQLFIGMLGKADGRISLSATGGGGGYSYTWSNGPTGPVASGLAPGKYWYKVADASGCYTSDTLELDTPEAFTMSLDADRNMCVGQKVILTPSVTSQASLVYNWTSTNGFFATTPTATITQPGTYMVSVTKGNLGNLGDQAAAYLKKFTVYPNPNSGQFTVGLEFNAITKARLRFINTLNNVLVNDRTVEGSKDYNLAYNYGGQLIGGTYILIIETAKGNFVYKVVVQ